MTRSNIEALDQRRCFLVVFRIQSHMRMAIAAQKSLKPRHVAILGAAHDHRAPGAGLKEANATQDHCAHHPLAEIRLRD
jgi:hypothetical protein